MVNDLFTDLFTKDYKSFCENTYFFGKEKMKTC
ncbi:hypothetical protein MgSA37_02978 [Mucilaginibacter gotjawali]|uniref:Uncharacterized protein n=2 Tax=Mucilaginibacter gotjawali TaxID=1550579 RepID=A0A0X8X368_9SPHI|nr:hypothetical protein [Mucilaginibacter gotjawali]BAU54800.1 hypothetical protein MgSA37_02978 [Mucilaginibacter gotjawali]